MDKILFYKIKDPYGEFSNFSPFGFIDNEEIYWPTSELQWMLLLQGEIVKTL